LFRINKKAPPLVGFPIFIKKITVLVLKYDIRLSRGDARKMFKDFDSAQPDIIIY